VAFAQAFRERFPQIEFVGQGELLKDFREQDLHSDLLNETMRRKIGELFGVHAIIVGNVFKRMCHNEGKHACHF
jgi:hypothetical protein